MDMGIWKGRIWRGIDGCDGEEDLGWNVKIL
jgi:hypothetical protein